MVKFKNNNNAQSSKKETDKNNEDSGRNINQNITKSKLIGSNSIRRINKRLQKRKFKIPDIFCFNIDSKFIYDFTSSDSPIYKISNINKVKATKEDLNFLSDKINEINISLSERTEKFISINKNIMESISNYFLRNYEKTELENFILEEILKSNDRSKISCRNLAELYTKQTGHTIHKTHVNNVMRKLGLHYLKTSVKTKKIESNKNKIISFCFIKVLVRAMKMGFKILYQDESQFLCSNNNFRCWKFEKENIFYGEGKKEKKKFVVINWR